MAITKEQLDNCICDVEEHADNTQTFREFIRESEKEFGMAWVELESLSEKELNDYIGFLDYLWTK